MGVGRVSEESKGLNPDLCYLSVTCQLLPALYLPPAIYLTACPPPCHLPPSCLLLSCQHPLTPARSCSTRTPRLLFPPHLLPVPPPLCCCPALSTAACPAVPSSHCHLPSSCSSGCGWFPHGWYPTPAWGMKRVLLPATAWPHGGSGSFSPGSGTRGRTAATAAWLVWGQRQHLLCAFCPQPEQP